MAGMYGKLQKSFDDIECHNTLGVIYKNTKIPEVPKVSQT